ncbi:MAG TPA: 4Fe-4S dicluster domain-containing protein [Candidatus Edwardsbacteria bacterium]|nr:4Fe-4S dicluster domain-containing protein [Candidatus Edwardsbacteria bacterium]
MARRFPGGHEWPATRFLYGTPIEHGAFGAELAIPLWGGGAAAVRPGAELRAHQAIGADRNGLPVFCPCDGTVAAVEDFAELAVRPQRRNIPRLTVRVKVRVQQGPPEPAFEPRPRFWELTRAELDQRLFAAGVLDLRGKELPKAVVFDGLDPEPPLSTNLRLLLERPAELIEGMRILVQAHGATAARLAVPARQRALYAKLRSLLASSVNLKAERVANVYPARHRAMLTHSLRFPADAAIYSMEDALRARQAVVEGLPLVAQFCTVWDERGKQYRNLELPAGTTVAGALGGQSRNYDGHKLVLGGMLSGLAVHTADAPLERGTAGVLLLDASRPSPRAACINCGSCLALCPARLAPIQIYRQSHDGRRDELARLAPGSCVACGLCSYICPARLDLAQQVHVARRIMREDAP